MRSVSPGLTWSCRWYMICDKAVMSRLQVAPSPPISPPLVPLHLSGREKMAALWAAHRELLSLPHLCGLRRDDLGLQPSQPSWHLRKKRGGGVGVGWRGNGRGGGWFRLEKAGGSRRRMGKRPEGVNMVFQSQPWVCYSDGAAEACLDETLCTAACSTHTADSKIKSKLHLFQCLPPGQRTFGI